ncbi:MAG: hypothetical protein HFG79_10920 [Lachnospiraceae bacterium]|nr:hypothetical protein [Lachnospiraceae bacterium]
MGRLLVKGRMVGIVCIIAVVSALFSELPAVPAAAAKKAKLKTKKITLAVGGRKTIKLKNKQKGCKYTYSSDKKKVASVTRTGIVRGKAVGRANITVKEKSKKLVKRVVGRVKVKVKVKDNVSVVDKQLPPVPSSGITNTVTENPVAITSAPAPAITPVPTPTPVPFANLAEVDELTEQKKCPDVFTYIDGTAVTAENWDGRAEEIRQMYQYYMYGMWRDGSGETLDYNVDGSTINISVTSDGTIEGQKENVTASFSVSVALPEGKRPAGGWPVIVFMGSMSQQKTALENGYAVITYDTSQVAADSASFQGEFYKMYPYDAKDWKKQSGVLMAWAWGASKVIDSLCSGAGTELGIDPDFAIIAGVSRWGKAAAVTGAFERRYKIAMPTCSGCGGMAVFRYNPDAKVTQKYDVSALGYQDTFTYKQGDVETISNLQGGEAYWFCERFTKFKSIYHLPFDQYYLSSLYAEEGRTLMLIGGFNWDTWQNTPSLWFNYNKAKEVFDMLGLGNNIIINLHDVEMGHDVVYSDVISLVRYCSVMYTNTPVPGFSIADLQSTLFDLTDTPSGINNKEVYEACIPD